MLITKVITPDFDSVTVITLASDIPAADAGRRNGIVNPGTVGATLETLHAMRCTAVSNGDARFDWVRADGIRVTYYRNDSDEWCRMFSAPITDSDADAMRIALGNRKCEGRPEGGADGSDTSWVTVDTVTMPDGSPLVKDSPAHARRKYLRKIAKEAERARDAARSAETPIECNIIGTIGTRDTGRFVA